MQHKSGAQSPNLVQALKDRASKIRDLEQRAEACLQTGDTKGYKQMLWNKAEVLEGLSSDLGHLAQEELGNNPGQLEEVQSRLQSFAQRAAQALGLESIFFMRMLLYPEDYTPGQPNDLERFIAELE